jgi:hypothetical protein
MTLRTIRLLVPCFALCAAALPSSRAEAQAPSRADSAAIRAVALDYIEGWYAGDAERMQRSLHPELAKRILEREANGGRSRLSSMTADQLVGATRRGGGRQTPAARRRTDVRIHDIFGNAASVRVDAGDWVDLMHLSRTDEGWRIVNVLWEYRPR